jgi:flavin reductase (DIM6/NTAB) family NADH-FMN oxidoreductase RutF
MAPEPAEFGSARFREVLGYFPTGVVVVTAWADRAVGMTAQSVVSLSLEPPLVLFCPAKTSTTWPSIAAVGHFCINMLASDQEDLCAAFAVSGGDKFAGVEWEAGRTGAPILTSALATVECTLENVYDGGDHEIAVGRAIALDVRQPGIPLVMVRGGLLDISTARPRPTPWKR